MWDFLVVSIGWSAKLPAIPCQNSKTHNLIRK